MPSQLLDLADPFTIIPFFFYFYFFLFSTLISIIDIIIVVNGIIITLVVNAY